MPLLPQHPHKHLIRELWPDKHLYASTLLLLGAIIGAAFSVSAAVIPVTYSDDMPTSIAGWNWPFGLLLPAIAAPLAIAAYRLRRPLLGFIAAGIEIASVGALGVVSLLGLAAIGFLVAGRREGEHENPHTRDLDPLLWPDKALAASLLFVVAGVASVVWGGMLLSDWLGVRSLDLTLWGILSIGIGAFGLLAALFCYWQRNYVVCVVAAVGLALAFGFVVVGPALAIGSGILLARARREGEFRA